MYGKDFFASKTTWGMIVALFGPVLNQYFGIAPDGQEMLVNAIVEVIGGVLFLWGQFTRKAEITTVAGVKISKPGAGTIKAIAPFLLVALFALGGPTGCAGMGAMAVPQTPAQQIAYAKATHTGLVNMTATLTETGQLTWVDAIGVREKLKTADATLALARSLVKQGIPADGLAQLEMAQKLLIELNNYLLAQEGDKP